MIIPSAWSLPEAIQIRLSQTTFGRQRALVEQGHVLLILHKPPGPDDERREGVLFWRNADGEWQSSRGGTGERALKKHVRAYAEIEHRLTETFEHGPTTAGLFDLVESLTPLVRASRNMHHAIQTAREAVKGDTNLIEVRDLAYDTERNFDLLLAEVRNAIQHRMAREAEEQADLSKAALQASHRLNVLAALFFPLTAIASIFGMNLTSGLNDASPVIFWIICALSVGLGLAIKNWVLAKPGKSSQDKPE